MPQDFLSTTSDTWSLLVLLLLWTLTLPVIATLAVRQGADGQDRSQPERIFAFGAMALWPAAAMLVLTALPCILIAAIIWALQKCIPAVVAIIIEPVAAVVQFIKTERSSRSRPGRCCRR